MGKGKGKKIGATQFSRAIRAYLYGKSEDLGRPRWKNSYFFALSVAELFPQWHIILPFVMSRICREVLLLLFQNCLHFQSSLHRIRTFLGRVCDILHFKSLRIYNFPPTPTHPSYEDPPKRSIGRKRRTEQYISGNTVQSSSCRVSPLPFLQFFQQRCSSHVQYISAISTFAGWSLATAATCAHFQHNTVCSVVVRSGRPRCSDKVSCNCAQRYLSPYRRQPEGSYKLLWTNVARASTVLVARPLSSGR